MNRRKQNISRWYQLGLAAVVLVSCLLISVGTAQARYQLDSERLIRFSPETAAQPCLGTMEGEHFNQYGAAVWKEALLPGEGENAEPRQVYQMDLAISNYLEMTGSDNENMRVYLRLLGTQDAWKGSGSGAVVLTDGTILPDGTPRQITATVTPIREDTLLYHEFGMGWEFRFLDEYGRELWWDLEGGQLSCVPLQLTMDAAALGGTSLLQLQVAGERVE